MIVLDTHAWLWWVSSSDELSASARHEIERGVADGMLYVSSISVWEVAMLSSRGRLQLTMPLRQWISHCESLRSLTFLPVTNQIALDSVQLPSPFHRDPADRIIVATARSLRARLVTKDDKIHNYPHVTAVW